MKKVLLAVVAFIMSVMMVCSMAFASEVDVSSLGDDELKTLFEQVKAEMVNRGLPITNSFTLREGKWIIGQDISPGTYTITCLESEGENLADAYSSLGDTIDNIDENNEGLGSLLGSLGGMMGDLVTTDIKVLGDYGTELKSFSLKGGESTTITLEENTALEISGGLCTLEAN